MISDECELKIAQARPNDVLYVPSYWDIRKSWKRKWHRKLETELKTGKGHLNAEMVVNNNDLYHCNHLFLGLRYCPSVTCAQP